MMTHHECLRSWNLGKVCIHLPHLECPMFVNPLNLTPARLASIMPTYLTRRETPSQSPKGAFEHEKVFLDRRFSIIGGDRSLERVHQDRRPCRRKFPSKGEERQRSSHGP